MATPLNELSQIISASDENEMEYAAYGDLVNRKAPAGFSKIFEFDERA